MWIDCQEQLTQLVGSVAPNEIWIDTEYDNQRYFAPRLALVQIAWSGGAVVIDPLEVDLAALNGWGGGVGLVMMELMIGYCLIRLAGSQLANV